MQHRGKPLGNLLGKLGENIGRNSPEKLEFHDGCGIIRTRQPHRMLFKYTH